MSCAGVASKVETTLTKLPKSNMKKARQVDIAMFPPLNLHDQTQEHQERQKRLLQARAKSVDHKDNIENRGQASSSRGDQQKTPTKEQKDILKQEQLRLKNEQKAQQKLEKEQHKLEKEAHKEQLKLEKEQMKLEKEQLKLEKEQLKLEKDQKSPSKNCFKSGLTPDKAKEVPCLKTQKSIDISCIKHQKSTDSPKPPARNSVDLQYTRNLLEATDLDDASTSSSCSSLVKVKGKK